MKFNKKLLLFAFSSLALITSGCSYEVKEIKKTKELEIYSFKDNNGVNGKFYDTVGTIDSKMYYTFLVKGEDDGLNNIQVPADKTTIYELGNKESNNARIEEYYVDMEYLGEDYFAYKVYIPKASIENEDKIKIDLE